jgi:mRNA-degrading endonuclease toxin of MazEF toxin-antitoxin module
MNKFDEWNKIKKRTENINGKRNFKEREIFNAKVGRNIGYEQNGVGNQFVRPILIFKKFNSNLFYGIPLSTTDKRNDYYFEFKFMEDKTSVAILSQMKSFDAKRLLNKIGMISKDDFSKLKSQLKEVLDL